MNTKEGIVQGPINNPYSYIPHRNGEPKDVTYCGDDESQGAWRERIRCIRERPGCRCYTVNSALNEEGEWEEVDVKERRRMWKAGRFSQWGKMPPELKIRVLEICDVPDAVCLSLASKEMHELAAPVLAKYDKPAALDKRYAMRSHGHTYTQQNFLHTYSTNIEPSKIIRPYWCTSRHCVGTRAHCSCISCPLFTRLETWVNSTFGSKSNASHKLKFCPGGNYSRYGWNSAGNDNCRRFTWRRKERRFLCTHGTPHVGKKALWPLNMRGDYHNCQKNKYWKKGYTETNMRRAMDRYKEEREDVGGYSLRKKPRPTVRRREHVYQRMRGRGEDGDEDEDEDVEMSD